MIRCFDALRIACKKKVLQPGRRVQIADGYLSGEKATVIAPPYPADWPEDEVWITFDRRGARIGWAILDDCQYPVDRLKIIG